MFPKAIKVLDFSQSVVPSEVQEEGKSDQNLYVTISSPQASSLCLAGTEGLQFKDHDFPRDPRVSGSSIQFYGNISSVNSALDVLLIKQIGPEDRTRILSSSPVFRIFVSSSKGSDSLDIFACDPSQPEQDDFSSDGLLCASIQRVESRTNKKASSEIRFERIKNEALKGIGSNYNKNTIWRSCKKIAPPEKRLPQLLYLTTITSTKS